ncbi:MAG: hypothetical protein M1823_005235 [Watsoniomyces obsoletus]|nr:MAG: hypothetical protein M1823_005235 [Watsoniomyces obsoletus]
MSSSASATGGGAGGAGGSGDRPSGERRQSLTKFMTRAKSALKRDKNKRRSSSTEAVGEPSSTPSTPLEGPPLASPTEEATTTTRTPIETIPERKEAQETEMSKKKTTEAKGKTVVKEPLSRSALQQERARALFEKYGMTLEPHEWATSTAGDRVERVQKPIRMRVHRTCHRCQTTFGVDRVCVQCGHKRCKACPRYPVKKPKHAQDKKDDGKVAGAIEAKKEAAGADAGAGPSSKKYHLTIPARGDKQDRVRRDVVQKVHRMCHRCERQFEHRQQTCEGCGHVRCTKCPRDPAKLGKWPHGYPGDEQAEVEEDEEADHGLVAIKPRAFKKIRMPVRWFCHECNTMYGHGKKQCEGCDHQRCQECRRVPAKKIKKSALDDPELVKVVEEKLAAFRLSSRLEEEEKENQRSGGGGTTTEGQGIPLRPSQSQAQQGPVGVNKA